MPRPKRELEDIVSEHSPAESMRRFTQALTGVVAVPKKEVDRRMAEWKRKRKRHKA